MSAMQEAGTAKPPVNNSQDATLNTSYCNEHQPKAGSVKNLAEKFGKTNLVPESMRASAAERRLVAQKKVEKQNSSHVNATLAETETMHEASDLEPPPPPPPPKQTAATSGDLQIAKAFKSKQEANIISRNKTEKNTQENDRFFGYPILDDSLELEQNQSANAKKCAKPIQRRSLAESPTSIRSQQTVTFKSTLVISKTPPVVEESKHSTLERRYYGRYIVVFLAIFSPFLVSYQKTILLNTVNELKNIGEFKGGLLKSAYPAGHILTQVVGGRLSEVYGSYWVLSLGSITMGVSCMLAPLSATIHFSMFFLDLVLLGLFAGFMTPALMTLFSNWLSPSEKALFVSFYLIASRSGQASSSFMNHFIMKRYKQTWDYCFYVGGALSFAYALVLITLVRSQPVDHWFISDGELNYLAKRNKLVQESISKKQAPENQIELREVKGATKRKFSSFGLVAPANPKSAPWLSFLASKAVWAFFLTKVAVKFCGDALQNELPKYLKDVIQDENYNSEMGKNYLIFCVGCLASGFLAKYAIKYKLFASKTITRKVFQCTASFSVSAGLIVFLMSQSSKSVTHKTIWFIFFITTLSTAGEAQMAFDMSLRYPGTLHALGSSLASLVGAIEPFTIGLILEGKSTDHRIWVAIWIGVAAISAFGGVIFLLFADARIQNFDTIGDKEDKKAAGLPEQPQSAVINGLPPVTIDTAPAKVDNDARLQSVSAVSNDSNIDSGRALAPVAERLEENAALAGKEVHTNNVEKIKVESVFKESGPI